MFERILVAYDGSVGAKRALITAVDIAKRYGAELHAIHVEEHLPKYAGTVGEVQEAKIEQNRHAKRLLKEAAEEAAEEGVALIPASPIGDPAKKVLEYARDNRMDLIVLGRRGLGTVQTVLFGSVSYKVLHEAKCPVLVVSG